jgi:hypothetical protein
MNITNLIFPLLLSGVIPAVAFPPAPTFTIRGIARNPYGWAYKTVDQAIVVIKQAGIIISESAVNETALEGENFRLEVPMDVNTSDPYRSGAQSTGALMTIEVRLRSQTLLVSSVTPAKRTIGQPAGSLFLDFTVGADTDGDNLPDDWEYWQLFEAGIWGDDPLNDLSTFGFGDFDGDGTSDYVEYLAGTFAFLATESLRLEIEGREPDGSARLQTLVVVGKDYRVECSADLKSWTTAQIRLEDPNATLVTTFTATDTREINLYSPSAINQPKLYFRLVLVW